MTAKIKKQLVYNPNILKDIKFFLSLELSESEISNHIKSYSTELEKKLTLFIDRIEFIEHLKILSKNAENNNFKIDEKEVIGVNWDISALIIYLALTSIDIFKDTSTHKEYFQNVFENISDELKKEIESNIYIADIKDITKKDNSLSSISEYLYNVRNNYTHYGLRFHDPDNVALKAQIFEVGSIKHKIEKIIVIANVKLVDVILKVAVFNVKKIFNFN